MLPQPSQPARGETPSMPRQIKHHLVLLLLAVWGLACSGSALADPAAPRPRVGLALSGGGARGLAHIGVLRVLERAGLPVDCLAGTSMGSIIGGLYSAGYTPDQIQKVVGGVDWEDAFSSAPARTLLSYDTKNQGQRYLVELGLDSGGKLNLPAGLISGYKLTAMLTGLCLPVAGVEDFDHLAIPFRAVATDLVTGETVVLGRGSLAMAMRASMSIPGAFPPFELEDRVLVDGGVVQNLPVQTVKEQGAQVVIGVNVSTPLRDRAGVRDIIGVMDQTISIQMIAATHAQARQADLVIAPDLTGVSNADFANAEQIVAIGEEAARQALPRLKALARQRGIPLVPYQRPDLAPVRKVLVQRVSLEGPPEYAPDLHRLAPFKPGQEVSLDELDRAVQRFYGLGTIENVSYEVRPLAEGGNEVVFLLRQKPYSAVVGRFGFRVQSNGDRSGSVDLLLNLRRPNLGDSASYAEADLSIGRNYGVAGRLRLANQPWQGLFFQPEIYYHSNLHDVYNDGDIKAQFTLDKAGLILEAGQELGTWGELRLGWLLERGRLAPHIATIDLPTTDATVSAARLFWGLDTLDRRPYATRGLRSEAYLLRSMRDLGSSADFTQLGWGASVVLDLGGGHYLEPNWDVATALDTAPPYTQLLFLGGYPNLWGYSLDEFYGQNLARVQLLYRYRLRPQLFLLGAVNGGRVEMKADDLVDNPGGLYWGGGLGLGWGTPLGPLEVVGGLGEGGRLNGYVSFGYDF